MTIPRPRSPAASRSFGAGSEEVLDATAGEPRRLLSLCAGDGRDVIPVLGSIAASAPISAHLIELDEELALRAARSASSSGLERVEVRCADAGEPASYRDVLPVDVLLLCGIFGNIEHGSVKDMIDVLPNLLAIGGYVIWTRGASEPDRRPEIRCWFRTAGLVEVSFDGAPERFGVGVNQLEPGAPRAQQHLPGRLFSSSGGGRSRGCTGSRCRDRHRRIHRTPRLGRFHCVILPPRS